MSLSPSMSVAATGAPTFVALAGALRHGARRRRGVEGGAIVHARDVDADGRGVGAGGAAAVPDRIGEAVRAVVVGPWRVRDGVQFRRDSAGR